MRKLFMILTVLALASCGAAPAFAQNASSGSPRVQGVPAGYGDPVQVTLRSADGSAPTLTTGAATSANQTSQITQETAINTVLGAVTASPTANTIGDRLKVLNTSLTGTLTTLGSRSLTVKGTIAYGNTGYTASQAIGALTTIPTGLPASTVIVSGTMRVKTLTTNATAVVAEIMAFFDANPSTSTFTDHTAINVASADVDKTITLTATTAWTNAANGGIAYVTGTVPQITVDGSGNVYFALISGGVNTFAGTGTFSYELTVRY